MTRVATALLALVALGAPALARADTTPPPCVGSGLVAIVQPTATAAVTLGPAVSAATKQGTPTASFHDAQYSVDLTNAVAGAAGCVGASAPGGTHAATGAWSVLGGALRGSALTADLVPAGGDGSGWHLRTTVTGLEVAGTATDAVPGATVAVADWGTLSIAAQADLPRLAPLRHWAAALSLRLVKAHAGLPAGTVVLVGYAAANRAPAPPPEPERPPATTTAPATTAAPTTTAPATTTAPGPATSNPKPKPKPSKPKAKPRAKPKPRKRARAHAHPRRKVGQPLTVLPPLQVSGDVFPVAGGADWGDTYGGERSDVPGGWHHGDDLFAPLGTPVVAVASGTVFAVGWNEVGGWRLWLRDAAGNSFYYAHLSGYTRLARDNGRVERGDVLGFVGNTGDAFTTEPHLHFEVHPNATLYLGYDGAVDPTTYLRSWPLARGVHVLPPVRLPGIAPTGFGSVTDFRKLLAVHPMPVPRRPATKKENDEKNAPAQRPQRSALGGARTARAASGGDGALPVVFAVVLLACGLGAVAHTARVGRT